MKFLLSILGLVLLTATPDARVDKWEQLQQGAGAKALIAKKAKARPSPIPLPRMPKAILPGTNTYFFAATAKDNQGLESDWSNEVRWTNVARSALVILAWDAPVCTNIITNCSVYWGRASRTYTNTVSAGTNLTATVRVIPPPLTNLVITVTSQNATNLQWCAKLGFPWVTLGATNWTGTNPPTRYWRAIGRRTTPGKVFISRRLQ